MDNKVVPLPWFNHKSVILPSTVDDYGIQVEKTLKTSIDDYGNEIIKPYKDAGTNNDS